jgi:enterochelin esterase family protein
VHAATDAAPGAPPVTMTCGTAEENLANNRLMAAELASTGIDVSWGQVRQGHTWTCWRDSLDPHLTDLLTSVWKS